MEEPTKKVKTFFKVNWKTILFLTFFCFFIFFFLSYKLTEVPPGINGDEASIGYNAILLSQDLRDENNRLLPLFTLTLNGKDWKQPVTMYSTAILFRLFGPSYFLLRAVSILILILSGILLFVLVGELISLKAAWISLILFFVTPIIVIQSHLALENIAPLPFIIIWLLTLYKFSNKNPRILLSASGIALGISIYSYNGMRLVVPVLIVLSLVYIWTVNTKTLTDKYQNLFAFFLGFLPFLILLPLANHFYGGALLANNKIELFKPYQQFLNNYLSNFDLSFLFVTGDTTPYHSTGKQGVFLAAFLPLFISGAYQSVKQKNKFLIFLLTIFLIGPILYGFVDVSHRGSRLLFLVPSFIVITTFGLITILNSRLNYKALIVGLMVFLIVFNFGDFLRDYYFEYPKRVVENFKTNTPKGFKELAKYSKQNNLFPAVQADLYSPEEADADFFTKVFFNKVIVWKLDEPPPDNSVILGADHLTNLSKYGLREEPINGTTLSLYHK